MFSTSKVKRRQKFVWRLPDGVWRLNPKSQKNYQNTKSTNQDENFSKKSMLSTLKKNRSQKFAWRLPDRICRLDLKSWKKYWNIKSTNQRIFFKKKIYLVTKKCKGAKNSYGGYTAELAGSTQNPKKMIEKTTLPTKTKIFPKSMFSSLKVKRSLKFVSELPDGICRLNPKCEKKTVGTLNQPIRTKIFPTKVCLLP
jgi:hypothetical protein